MKYKLIIILALLVFISCSSERKNTSVLSTIFFLEDGEYQCITDSGAKAIRNWGREDILIKKSKEENYIKSRTCYAHPSFHLIYTQTSNSSPFLLFADNTKVLQSLTAKIKLERGDTLMKLCKKDSSLIATNIHLAISTSDSLIFNYINK